ncbi:hypothetical protein BJ944DRAFT_279394 [Cunninghamella echinulata]|nr:hypothetical protein BJ944DRAFT_279394 [Cunninghamella echinulata]
MEQELYYLIVKFLGEGPCKESAKVLENELNQHRQLLPHTMTYDGSQVPLSIERLAMKYPDVDGKYLLSLLGNFLQHYKNTGDPSMLRSNALRHGDESLLTMLSAFVPGKKHEKSNYLTMSYNELTDLSIHRKLIAREMGIKILQNACNQAFLSTFYKERVTLHGHRFPVFCLAFDKTNRRLFTGSDDYLVKVWCVRTGYLIYTIRGHRSVITDIAINEENTLLATASSDGFVRVWTMDGYRQVVCLRPITSVAKPFTTVRFSPSPRSETRYLMATNEDGLVRLWKWNRDTLQFSDPESPITYSCKFKAIDKLRCSSFNYTGSKFTVAGDDGFVYVFSAIKKSQQDTAKSTRNELKASSQDGPGRGRRKAASALFPDKGGQDQLLPVVPIAILEGHMGSVTDLAYSHDGQRILSGSQDGTARIWSYNKQDAIWNSIILDIKESKDAPIVKPSSEIEIKQKAIRRLSNANLLIDNSSEIGTCIPPLSPPLKPYQSLFTQDNPINNANSNDSNTLSNDTSQQINTNNGQQENEEPPKVSMITWSADDRLCIVATTYGDIKVYNSYNGELTCILKGHQGETYAVDSHPQDPSTILSAGYDGNVILWDIRRQSVITWHNHQGRVFLDCKFSKDGMKYAITDDEGKCTLFGINGLDKDYAQARTWLRGQYFYNDYHPVRYNNNSDGSFVDDQTNLPTHALPPSPIIDLQGVEYPHQPRRGYGRDIGIHAPTFELEDAQRAMCYDKEEMDILSERPAVLPVMDRAQIAKRRREFVRNDDDDENDIGNNANVPIFQFPMAPVQPNVLPPDDSDDEDYHDEGPAGRNNDSSEADSEEEQDIGSDESMNGDETIADQWDETEDGPPVTRSRAGRLRHSQSPEYSENTNNRQPILPRGRPASATRGTGRRGRPPRQSTTRAIGRPSRSIRNNNDNNTSGTRRTRASQKRRRGLDIQSDDDETQIRPRRRTRNPQMSYAEASDPDDFEDSEDDLVDVTDSNDETTSHQVNMSSEAGPSNSTRQGPTRTRSTVSYAEVIGEEEDNDDEEYPNKKTTGKRKIRSIISDSDEEDESNENTTHLQRMTRSQQQQSSTSSSNTVTTGITSKGKGKGKGKARSNSSNKPLQRTVSHRSRSKRDLTDEEIEYYLPSSWISATNRSVEKYLPQMGDHVAILSEGYQQYWDNSELKNYFDEKFAPCEIKLEEPVTFATIVGISWYVGPPTYCRLKLQIQELTNMKQVFHNQANPIWGSQSPHSRDRNTRREEITIEFSDEDGCPEFLVLWERFLASMSLFFGPTADGRQRVDAIYDDGKYTGLISATNDTGVYWKQADSKSPWACYHVIWDDESSPPEDLSPWEVVPTGEDFTAWYDVGPSLTDQEIQRANAVLDWITSTDDFLLYVDQVDYYAYRSYLSKIAYPICLNTVRERLNNGFYRRIEALIDDVELIRKNAQKFNHETSPASKNSVRMANFFKSRVLDPHKPLAVGRPGNRRKVQEEESDDEYNDANVNEESEESASENKKETYIDDDDNDDDDFIDDYEEDD